MIPRRSPLPTRDPVGGGEVVVTRLEAVDGGVAIEGRFELGWLGRLTPEQLDFVGLLLARRNNLQRLAADLGVAYNTARNRLDEIVEALGGSVGPASGDRSDRREVLRRVAAGELSAEEARPLLE